jgi:phage-related protein
MTITALPLPEKIGLESSKSTMFRELAAQFGDGYQQVAPNGINNKIDSWSIIWSALTLTEVATVESVLNSTGSWGILSWTPYSETSKKYRMTKDGYARIAKGKGNGVYSITCKLIQVFDLG